MGRPRKKNRSFPPGVYFNHDRWFLRRDGKETKLAGAAAKPQDVWNAYLALSKPKDSDNGTLEWLCDQYLESNKFQKLAPATQRDYLNCKEVICCHRRCNSDP
jgi:hypothetical protein